MTNPMTPNPTPTPPNHPSAQGESRAGAVEPWPNDDEGWVQRCWDVIRTENKASTSFLQRRLRLGYTRAARYMDLLAERGFITEPMGARHCEILKPNEPIARIDAAPTPPPECAAQEGPDHRTLAPKLARALRIIEELGNE